MRFFGADVTGCPPYKLAAMGIGYVPEGRRIFTNLTVEENLMTPVERPGAWTIPRVYEVFPRLAQRRFNKGSQLRAASRRCSRFPAPCCSIRSS